MALAGFFAVSCVQEHIDVIYDPANVEAQTLGSISGCTLAEDGDPITVSYNEADFNLDVPVSYTLLANVSGDGFDNAKKVDCTIADGTITIEQAKLNKLLGSLGATPDDAFATDFRLDACLMNERGSVASTRQCSNVVTAMFTVYETEKDLDVVDVPGDYQGWAPSDYPKLFNYSFDGTIYRGVVDFRCVKEDGNAANGFKITYGGNWDNDSGNWGSAAQGEAAEADQVQLVNGDGSQNIVCYGARRYYLFSFNKEALTLTKIMSFDKVGIIGLNGDWDNDIVMTYNMYKGRFWADVDVADATEFKFRLDGSWDNNWGGNLDALSSGDANIPIDAGQYRIYFYMNDETLYAEIDATMYGQEEPTVDQPEPGPGPGPVPYQGWGIIGVGGDWETDIAMTGNGGIWTGYANLTAGDNWKLRKDAGWDENFGGSFKALGEPFEAVAGGDNIAVGAAGFFKIELNANDGTITVSDGEVWSLIGEFNSWAGDVDMTLQDGKWVSPATALTPGWKIRHNHAWDADRGGTFTGFDTPFEAAPGGNNIDCGEGEFIVTYDPAAETITVTRAFPSDIWSVIGGFEASCNWQNDVKMTFYPGIFNVWVSEPIAMKAGDEFKLRYNRGWEQNRGIVKGMDPILEYDMAAPCESGGDNLKAPGDGTYVVCYSEAQETIFFMGWGMIGQINGTNWDKDFMLYPTGEETVDTWMSDAFYYEAGQEFKIRYKQSWDNTPNRGGSFVDFGAGFAVEHNGPNISLPESQWIFVAYSPAEEEIYIGRTDWGIVGGFNGWGDDVPMFEIEPGVYYGNIVLAEAGDFKIRKDRAWDVDRGGTFGEADTPFEVSQGGPNISLGAGSYTIVYDSSAETIEVCNN